MKAAIDSVSLIFVLKDKHLKTLVKSYLEKIYITKAVYGEVFESKVSEELVPIRELKPLFEQKEPKKILHTKKLGNGELSAISLALEKKLLFISEDRKATLFASSIGVKSASLLSILIKARNDEKINKKDANNILFRLVENGFYMSSEVFSTVLQRLEKES